MGSDFSSNWHRRRVHASPISSALRSLVPTRSRNEQQETGYPSQTMMISASLVSRRSLSYTQRCSRRSLSSMKVDPSRLVHGTKIEDLNDAETEAYFRSNFPEAFVEREALLKKEEDEKEVAAEIERLAPPKNYPLNIRPIYTYKRCPETEEGTRACRTLRWNKMIPGILRGGDPNLGIYSHQEESKIFVKTPWKELQKELDRYHRHFESRVYDLTVYEDEEDTVGTTHRVIPQNVQWHPLDWKIYCANFCRYHPGRPIKLPVTLINEEESPALKREGFLIPIQRYIECFIEEGVTIPEALELECSGLKIKEVVRKDRLVLPEGVRFSDRVLKHNDFVVGVVFGSSRDKADDVSADSGEGPTET